MNKYDFINQLDDILSGNVSEQERIESVQYYKDYIDSELSKGKSEEEIIDFIGSPLAVAKSIIDAKGYESAEEVVYDSYDEKSGEEDSSVKLTRVEGWKAWFVIAGIILVLLLILSFVFHLFAAILPFLLPFLIVLFIMKLFFSRR